MTAETQVESRVPAGRLEKFVRDLFRAAGVPGDDAETIAAAVVGQEIRGLTTHGLRMVDWNLKGLAEGRIRAAPDQPTLSDHGMTAVIEGDHGVGMVGCMKAMRLAVGKACEGGIGIVLTVRNNHFLAATPYCLESVKAGMVGIAFSNTKPTMGYPGARGRAIGNSPLGFGIPTAAGFPILFDASLTISGGRLRQWIREAPPVQPFPEPGARQPLLHHPLPRSALRRLR